MTASLRSPDLHRLPARLADGREIVYFDETADPVRVLDDPRDLPVVVPASQARYDALTGDWVGIAGHRQTRTYHPPADACPLCPSTPANASEIPSPDYDVVVFENRFPSFGGAGEPVPADPQDRGSFVAAPGNGRCEVVCFTPDHTALFSRLPPRRVRTVIEAWVDRTEALSAQPGIEQVFCFENRGAEIGVTLAHPHGQIYGYPFVTPRTSAMLRTVAEHRRRTGRNLFDDVLAGELADGSRVVAGNRHWAAFVPFAARWPVEVHLYPRRRVPDLAALDDAERDALALLYLEVLRRMEGVFADTLPAISAWHQAPVRQGRDDWGLHLEIFSIRRAVGKLKYLAGSESAMGAFINDIAPEAAAERLRQVVVPAPEVDGADVDGADSGGADVGGADVGGADVGGGGPDGPVRDGQGGRAETPRDEEERR
ncbi:galactose-1-phosphate uridylyltransferase [Nakamurella endophytica]|uniref:Galactose-1-phosphate uridylyltransferase n=1 Tax=Nakamurella endophytica TaxID=1748367 RepID=A0A917SUD6_9ACTN|nr:galactose-1-phosphate uridylyltransferase [Nakamurella endophytica]GGL96475.1 galactose-1-phosphate uridylyltransferase [Nakamurella endophytica]